MVRAMTRAVATSALVLSVASHVRACPLCESEAGQRVRSGIFDASFGYHLAVTLLPFLVFVAIVGLIHFGPPRSRTPHRAVDDPRHQQAPMDSAPKDQQ